MLDSSAAAGSPISESPPGAAPNLLARLVREWPDAVARATIVTVALALFWLTWAHWGSIQVDCGREVYVPYEILRGKLLYRDLWYPYGPLEPYVSALLFKLFGEHLSVLYCFGLALAIGCALVVFDFGKLLAGRAVGLTAALVLLLQGFGCDRGLGTDTFNYIFPYTYSAILGLLFSLACLLSTVRHVVRQSKRDLMLAGLAAGLALITKQEMGIACYMMLTFVLVLEAVLQRSVRRLMRGIGACAPGFALAMVVYGWFFWKAGAQVILYANWQYTPGAHYMQTVGPRMNAAIGLRFVPSELMALIANSVTALALWFLIARACRHLRRWPFVAIVALVALVLGLVHYYSNPLGQANYVAWYELLFPRGLFFIGVGFLAYTLNELRKKPADRCFLAEAALAVFALVSGIRVLAETAPSGYSIFYTVPLFLVFLIAVTRVIAAAASDLSAERRNGLIISLLAAEVILLATVIVPIGSGRNTRFQTTWGAIYLSAGDASTARQIYNFMLDQKQHERRVLLVPELSMMYAFTRTEAPSRWYNIDITCLSLKQEEKYVETLTGNMPDYVIECNWRPAIRGTAFYVVFGKDYDQKIFQWIETNYHTVEEFGRFRRDENQPLTALVYRRNDLSRTARGG
jgi:Dolichyl-phosphate-mannose-protein mannosyltransferase